MSVTNLKHSIVMLNSKYGRFTMKDIYHTIRLWHSLSPRLVRDRRENYSFRECRNKVQGICSITEKAKVDLETTLIDVKAITIPDCNKKNILLKDEL